jgi:hypothetical protein
VLLNRCVSDANEPLEDNYICTHPRHNRFRSYAKDYFNSNEPIEDPSENM